MDASTAGLIAEDASPITGVWKNPAEPHVPVPLSRILARIAIVGGILLGFGVRGWLVLSRDFPLNDGGLFYQMTRDLQAAHYSLPAFTTYNSAHIPFGYSPLAFYLAGALTSVFHISLMQAFRVVPLVATCLTVVAFARLAQRLLKSDTAVAAAIIAFALLPRSYVWLIMGGGITRSLGFLFAILALEQLHQLYTNHQTWRTPLVALLAAATVLTHLGTGPFLAFSAILFLVAFGRSWYGLAVSASAGLGALVATAPWWASIMTMHGAKPFLAARDAGNSVLSQPTLGQIPTALAHFGLGTSEPILPIIGMLALMGALSSVVSRRWFLPGWWVLVVLIDARAGATYATLPLAMLAGVAVAELIEQRRSARTQRARVRSLSASAAAVAATASAGSRPPSISHRHPPATVVPLGSSWNEWPLMALLGLLFCFSLVSAVSRNRDFGGELRDLQPLSLGERNAMQWAASALPPSSRVLIVSGRPWEVDRSSEWFPVLAKRVSIATVQGSEWLVPGEFVRRQAVFNDAQGCANWFAECLTEWEQRHHIQFTHVYIPKDAGDQCCRVLLESLRRHSSYALVYDGDGAAIFRAASNEVAVGEEMDGHH